VRRTLAALATLALAAGLLAVTMAPALATSPHFVGTPTATRDGDTLTVAFKLAGLGNTDQTITLTSDVSCRNGGGNEPKAENKGDLLATGVFSQKNGNVVGSLSGTGTTDPACNPPMTLVYANVTVTDVTAQISYTFPGTL
jgi:hypothetical protein